MGDSFNAIKAKWVPNSEKLLRCSKKKAAECWRMDRKDTQTKKTRTMLPAVTQRDASTHPLRRETYRNAPELMRVQATNPIPKVWFQTKWNEY